jgi:hypothetical protein
LPSITGCAGAAWRRRDFSWLSCLNRADSWPSSVIVAIFGGLFTVAVRVLRGLQAPVAFAPRAQVPRVIQESTHCARTALDRTDHSAEFSKGNEFIARGSSATPKSGLSRHLSAISPIAFESIFIVMAKLASHLLAERFRPSHALSRPIDSVFNRD